MGAATTEKKKTREEKQASKKGRKQRVLEKGGEEGNWKTAYRVARTDQGMRQQ